MSDKNSYLERKFIEYLNEPGDIAIESSTFLRSEILHNLDKPAYKEAFENWKQDYNTRLAEIADRQIELFGTKQRFLKLKNLFSQQNIIPFVGAGLSKLSGLPLWNEFLDLVAHESSIDRNKFNDLMRVYEYEEAAQYLDNHCAEILQENLENQFGQINSFEKISGVVCRFPEFFNETSIITNNYDDILKTVYEFHGTPFNQYLDGLTTSELPKLLSNGRNLLKLHGSHLSKSRRILTETEYNNHYSEDNSINSCLSALLSKSILFIGCSLDTDRTVKALTELVQQKGSDSLPRHYAFLPCPRLNDGTTDDDTRKTRAQTLSEANIFPIWYDGDHDECIEAFLEKLANP